MDQCEYVSGKNEDEGTVKRDCTIMRRCIVRLVLAGVLQGGFDELTNDVDKASDDILFT